MKKQKKKFLDCKNIAKIFKNKYNINCTITKLS